MDVVGDATRERERLDEEERRRREEAERAAAERAAAEEAERAAEAEGAGVEGGQGSPAAPEGARPQAGDDGFEVFRPASFDEGEGSWE